MESERNEQVQIMYENARKYNLTGTDAMVFEALCALCRKTGEWKGSFATLARYSCCGDKATAFRTLQRLIERGLVLQNATGTLQIATETLQNATNSKEERTKEENINNKKSGVVIDHTTHTTFSSFFNLFSPNGEFKSYEKSCKKIWQTMPEDWRKLAVEKAPAAAEGRNPYYYLSDEDFLKSDTPQSTAKPQWLSGDEIDSRLRDGIPLAVCRNPETGKFGTVTKEDAEKFKLTITRIM